MIVCLEQGADFFSYGPDNATVILKNHHLIPHITPDGFIFLVVAYPACPVKEAVERVNRCSNSTSSMGIFSVINNSITLI